MRRRHSRLVLSGILILALAILFPSPTLAEVPPVKWTSVPIPAQGEEGGWVLASGSDVRDIAVASDGALFASVTTPDTTQTLFKSSDNGTTWAPSGQVTAAIVDIAAAPDDPDLVYYATASNVYRSADGGLTFTPLPPNPSGAGSGNVAITAISVAVRDKSHVVIVATRNTSPGQFGGVYTLDESQLIGSWQNTGIGDYDIVAVAASPNYVADRQLVAVASSEIDMFVISRVGSAGWGLLAAPAAIRNIAPVAASIAFPDDYAANADTPTLFVALSGGSGNGDIYKVTFRSGSPGSVADLNAGASFGSTALDISCLAVSGNATSATLIAGASASSTVVTSTDGGSNWRKCSKEPTGQAVTALALAPDFSVSGKVYASTSGTESAFSQSDDGGNSWNQTGLIDTQITSNSVIDLAVSPEPSDASLFLLTWGGEHSLWRSRDAGETWSRVFCSALAGIDAISRVAVSPCFGSSDNCVFVLGAAGLPALWRSADGGDTFVQRGIPYAVDAWTVLDGNTLFIAGYDGTNALVCSSGNGGFFFSPPVTVGSQPLWSIALSPDLAGDKTIAAGSTIGRVYLSTDNGTSFKQLGQQLPLSGTGVGQVSIAFDPDFGKAKKLYAATDAASTTASRERVFSFVVGKSKEWESIDSTLPAGGMVSDIAIAVDGALYATNSKAVVSATPQGGIERSLNPQSTSTAVFETVIRGLNDGAALSCLSVSGNQLWCLDTANTRLITFVDTLSQPPTLTSPIDGAGGIDINNVRLQWKGPDGATTCQWQLANDDDFSDIPNGFDATTQSSSSRPPVLQMARTYDWRVRATGPILSPWSAKASFTTRLGNTVVAPELITPAAGATGVVPDPVFQWTSIADAENYEMLLGNDATLKSPIISKTGEDAVGGTAWHGGLSLAYGKTYFWKVRAIGNNSTSAWSNTGAFTVQAPPTPATPAAAPLTVTTILPQPTPSITINNTVPVTTTQLLPTWAIVAIIAVGLLLVLLLAAILVVMWRRR